MIYRGCDLPEDLAYDVERDVWARLERDGSVTLGMPAPAANILLVPLFRRLRAAHPQIRLRIEEVRTVSLLDGLLAGHLDVAITAHEEWRPAWTPNSRSLFFTANGT